MQLFALITETLNSPPIPFKPDQQTLKGWVMYCLRDRGFKVIYAQNADFAVEQRDGSKVYFKVTDHPDAASTDFSWIVYDRETTQVHVTAPPA